jgi:hypothetical protein
MKHLVTRSYFRIITDDATGSSRSVSLRRTAKMAMDIAGCKKWQELLKRITKDDATDVAKR